MPLLASHGRADARSVLRYAFLAAAPVALLLLPFALADLPALARELVAYSGDRRLRLDGDSCEAASGS